MSRYSFHSTTAAVIDALTTTAPYGALEFRRGRGWRTCFYGLVARAVHCRGCLPCVHRSSRRYVQRHLRLVLSNFLRYSLCCEMVVIRNSCHWAAGLKMISLIHLMYSIDYLFISFLVHWLDLANRLHVLLRQGFLAASGGTLRLTLPLATNPLSGR